jgi:hypothetical protein
MRTYHESRLIRIALVVFFCAIILYGAYELRGLLAGPVIEIERNLIESTEQFVTIEGNAARIATLTMNGLTIPVTEDGSFSEGYVLSEGYNRVVLEAKDRYGNSAREEIEIIYRPTLNSMSTTTAQ